MIYRLLGIIPSLSIGIAMLFIGLYFRTHVHIEIGKNGICLPSAEKKEYKWLYTQAIGPRVLIMVGLADLVISVIIGSILTLLGGDDNIILILITVIGFSFLIGALLYIDHKTDRFMPEWLEKEDNVKREQWLNAMKEYAEKKQFVLFEKLAQSEE